MPTIDITADQFQRFQSFAEPLVDTPQSAFEKLLALGERSRAVPERSQANSATEATPLQRYDRSSLPGVRHTAIRSARVDGATVRNEWNAVLLSVLAAVAKRTNLQPALRDTPINTVAAKKNDEGYTWREALGLSVQGVSADTAARAVTQLCDTFAIPLEIRFEWRRNPKAAKPGQQGRLVAGPAH